jgi:hypothetical protein
VEIYDIAILFLQALDVARCVGWIRTAFLSKGKGKYFVFSRLQVGLHSYESGLDSTPDRACAYNINAIEIWKYLGEILALLATLRSEIWVRNSFVVLCIMVAFSMANEVNNTGSHNLSFGMKLR